MNTSQDPPKIKTILDQHIDLWQATIETHERRLRSCFPNREDHEKKRLAAARAVLITLQHYKQVVEHG